MIALQNVCILATLVFESASKGTTVACDIL